MFDAGAGQTEDADASQGVAARELRARIEALHPEAWRWALACCGGDEEVAMEALQDSYLSVIEGRARFAGRSSFKTFLFGVVRMTVRATRRRATVRDLFFAPIETAPDARAPEDQERSTQIAQTAAAFAQLAPRQRAVAELVLTHDLTVAEAAEVLGVSRGSASRHYALAKERLRRILNAEGAEND